MSTPVEVLITLPFPETLLKQLSDVSRACTSNR